MRFAGWSGGVAWVACLGISLQGGRTAALPVQQGVPTAEVTATATEGQPLPSATFTDTREPSPTPTPASTETATLFATATESSPPDHTATQAPTPTVTSDRPPSATATDVEVPSATPTPPATATRTSTPTRNPTLAACVGNCDASPAVTVDELVRGVNIALGSLGLEECLAFDGNLDALVTVDELVTGVNNALFGCGVTPPTPTRTESTTRSPTQTRTPSATETATQTPIPTLTHTRTATPSVTQTTTRTATATPVQSVCGGLLTSVPKLCDLDILPNPVRLGGSVRPSFCVSDLEGDINQFCFAIQTSPQMPTLQCRAVPESGSTINGCGTTTADIRITEPVGSYMFLLQFADRAGNRSSVESAPFQVVP